MCRGGSNCWQLLHRSREDAARLFSEVHSNRLRGHRHKLEPAKWQLDKDIFGGLVGLFAFKPWAWSSSGTHCPERFYNLLSWRCSRIPSHLGPQVSWSNWSCLEQEVGLDDLPRSLPAQSILWFHADAKQSDSCFAKCDPSGFKQRLWI